VNGFGVSKKTKKIAALTTAALLFSSTALQADGLDTSYSMNEQIHPCVAGEYSVPRVLVDVSGIESDEGTLRVQIYSDNPDDFLVSGKKVLRVEVPSQPDVQKVCVTFPQTGVYSMAVMHDKNANGRADIFTEGFGFSNNPKLGFGPPDHEDTLFEVGNGVKQMDVALIYYFQLQKKDSKRRRRR
jgi:uncharacterized protein (DUF2141 family)